MSRVLDFQRLQTLSDPAVLWLSKGPLAITRGLVVRWGVSVGPLLCSAFSSLKLMPIFIGAHSLLTRGHQQPEYGLNANTKMRWQ